MPTTGPDAIVSAILDQLHERRRTAIEAASSTDGAIEEVEERADDRLADAGALLVPARDRWEPSDAARGMMAAADRLAARVKKIDRRLGRWSVLRRGRRRERLREERMRRSAELRRLLIEIASEAGAHVARDVPEVELLYEQAARHRAEAAELRRRAFTLQLQIAQIDRDVARHTRRQAHRHLERLRGDLDLDGPLAP